MRAWVSPSIRDDVVEFVQRYSEKTGLSQSFLVARIGIGRDKFYDWRRRRGRSNDHNATIPCDFWLHEWEKRAILDFHSQHSEEGYRRLVTTWTRFLSSSLSSACTFRNIVDSWSKETIR